MEAHLADLDAVVRAEGLDRFALMGMSGYSTVALAYAARYPERVTRIVLYGGWPGFRPEMTDDDRLAEDAWMAMIRAGWNRPDPTFRRVFTQQFIPGASEQQMRWFDDLQRMSASTENVIAARKLRRHFDVRDQLEQIRAPTLVLHAVGDHAVSFEFGREVATRLPDARLVPLESENHILLADEPAWAAFRDELRDFMRPDRTTTTSATPRLTELSAREREVLNLAAEGRTNAEIAEAPRPQHQDRGTAPLKRLRQARHRRQGSEDRRRREPPASARLSCVQSAITGDSSTPVWVVTPIRPKGAAS